MKTDKFWIAIIAAVLAASVISAFLIGGAGASGATAEIYQDGKLIDKIDLSAVSEPYTLTAECDGGTNTIAVEPGRIAVVEADCPDGACIRQGYLSGGLTPIVCLPHRLVIKLAGADGIDGIAG